jgi:coproporphyrinogen III oxidase
MHTANLPLGHTASACLAMLTLAFLPVGVALGGAHSGTTGTLSDTDRTKLSTFYNTFVAEMDEKYFSQVEAMNGGIKFEDRIATNEYTDFDLRVARGDVMEKAGRMLTDGKKLSPGRGDGVLTWGRFYSLDMHPKTPLAGMLHATIVLQMFEDGSVATGGWLGVMPGAKVEADLTKLKKVTDDYFAERNKDPTLYRRLICKGTHDVVAEFRRRPACSGVSFYGPPVYPDDPEASIRFIAGMFDEFVGTYMAIAKERADDPFTATDLLAQDMMRKRWLIDQLFSDPYSSKIVPFDVWSFANVPPVIKF